MKPAGVRPVRCAIYTRVSTEHGLDQEFNSLDAQYDAASAYIKSQAHAGWTLIRSRYDDGGYSGGSTDRPDLQRLLDDIRSRKIDVIVVYKVDRLTRSLADFAKLVELFDAHGVSFVSVTQQFNTTTSMGRLTLNVLLSFAQFEREVTSERIRDKIAASKRKGLWVGGPLPLGYQMKDGKVAVVEDEAERVRLIFRRYLELGGVNALVRDLRERNIRSKIRPLATGGDPGRRSLRPRLVVLSTAQPFLYRRGQIQGRDPARRAAGHHGPRIVRCRSAEAHGSMDRQSRIRNASDHLLTGLSVRRRQPPDGSDPCDQGRHPLSLLRRHCPYSMASPRPHRWDRSRAFRLPASKICIVKALNEHLIAQKEKPSSSPTQIGDRNVILEQVARIDVHQNHLTIRFKPRDGDESSDTDRSSRCQFLGRSRRPESPGRSSSRTVWLQMKFVRPGLSDARALSTRSHEAVVGLTRSCRAR